MSILKDVMQEYGISETPKALTDKTDKRVKSPEPLTDKTDKRASVSSVSDRSRGFETQIDDLEPDEQPIAAEMLQIIQMREHGRVPDHYTSTTTCKHCGPVPIWDGCPPEVNGCPWCLNRHKGLPIPKGKL